MEPPWLLSTPRYTEIVSTVTSPAGTLAPGDRGAFRAGGQPGRDRPQAAGSATGIAGGRGQRGAQGCPSGAGRSPGASGEGRASGDPGASAPARAAPLAPAGRHSRAG